MKDEGPDELHRSVPLDLDSNLLPTRRNQAADHLINRLSGKLALRLSLDE
jgi:hypothetical protein